MHYGLLLICDLYIHQECYFPLHESFNDPAGNAAITMGSAASAQLIHIAAATVRIEDYSDVSSNLFDPTVNSDHSIQMVRQRKGAPSVSPSPHSVT